ncbi:hypothetical protein NBRC116583_15330 [Arenicella sp. 4NH20-0111]|uniref:hypothetical protein n=1 Tax=Arenicella sp. 4NH20-0111 TaxID=3127648 RepID=UPI00310B2134
MDIEKIFGSIHKKMGKRSLKLASAIVGMSILFMVSACSDDTADDKSKASSVKAKAGTQVDKIELSGSPSEVNNAEAADAPVEINEFGSRESAELSDELNEQFEADEYPDNEDSYNQLSDKVEFDAEQSEGIVKWQAPQDRSYANAKITVSNENGETAVRNFKPGESIELYGQLPDGVYKWKSVITPEIEDSVREQMRAVRNSGDIHAERELAANLRAEGSIPTEREAQDNVQFGSFVVLNGIVNPAAIDEPESTE